MTKFIPPGFDADRVSAGIYRAMGFGEPTRVGDKATFYKETAYIADDGVSTEFAPAWDLVQAAFAALVADSEANDKAVIDYTEAEVTALVPNGVAGQVDPVSVGQVRVIVQHQFNGTLVSIVPDDDYGLFTQAYWASTQPSGTTAAGMIGAYQTDVDGRRMGVFAVIMGTSASIDQSIAPSAITAQNLLDALDAFDLVPDSLTGPVGGPWQVSHLGVITILRAESAWIAIDGVYVTTEDDEAADSEGLPFDPTVSRLVIATPVVVPCAIEYFDRADEAETFGVIQPTKIKVTLLDVDYQQVKGFHYVAAGGDKYYYVTTEPPVALASIDVWTVHCNAQDET